MRCYGLLGYDYSPPIPAITQDLIFKVLWLWDINLVEPVSFEPTKN